MLQLRNRIRCETNSDLRPSNTLLRLAEARPCQSHHSKDSDRTTPSGSTLAERGDTGWQISQERGDTWWQYTRRAG